MKQVKPLTRRTPLTQRTTLQGPRTPVRSARTQPALRVVNPIVTPSEPLEAVMAAERAYRAQASRAFRRAISRKPCAVCQTTNLPRDPHHLISQQHLRSYVRSLRLPEMEARKLLRRLLSDVRGSLALCRPCHARLERRFTLLTYEQIPIAAWAFARELGPWATARLEVAIQRKV